MAKVKDLEAAVAEIEATRKAKAAEAADAELTAAHAADLAAALEESIRDGQLVEPSELRAARDVASHAELRAEAAKRAADRAVVDARQAACRALAAEVTASAAQGDAELTDAFNALATALDRLGQLAAARNTEFRRLVTAAHGLDVPPIGQEDPNDRQRTAVAGVSWSSTSHGGRDRIGVLGGAELCTAAPKDPVGALVERASQRFGWGLSIRGGDQLISFGDDQLVSHLVRGH